MTRWKCRLCINTAIFHSTAYSCVTRSTGSGSFFMGSSGSRIGVPMRPRTRYCCAAPPSGGALILPREISLRYARRAFFIMGDSPFFTTSASEFFIPLARAVFMTSETKFFIFPIIPPAHGVRSRFPTPRMRGATAIASAWTHRDTDAGTTRPHPPTYRNPWNG